MSTTTTYFVEAEDSRESVELFATAAHPDAVCSRSHLQAIETGEPCCSHTMSSALSDAFRGFLLKRYPQQLLEDLRVGAVPRVPMPDCYGYIADRDLNAALNILMKALSTVGHAH